MTMMMMTMTDEDDEQDDLKIVSVKESLSQ